MFGGLPGPQELLIWGIIIVALSFTGLWKPIMKGLRELRGEHVDEESPPSASDLDVCYRMLGLSPSAQWKDVESAYRQKAKIHHPDRGGDEDAMRALNEAYAQIKRSRGLT